MLPSIRNLARELQISVITTKRAYEELEREGFIETVGGKGSFVAGQNREFLREKQLNLLEEKLSAVVKEAQNLRINRTELKEMVDLLMRRTKMEKILEIKDLSKKYPGFNLDRVSFSLDKGFVMGFIGPNGAGKTTTIKLIMNLVRRDSGDIRIVGRDNIKDEVQVKREIGFVYEDCHFYEELTGRDFAKVVSSLYPRWDQAALPGIWEFGLPENKKIKELSGVCV